MEADDLILISVDDHIMEPPGMFDAHVPDRFRDQAPRVVVDDGGEKWWYGNAEGRNLGLNAVAGKPRDMFNVDPQLYSDMRPGCYDVHERVRDMSAGGQLGSLNFPNWTGFSGQVLNQGPDRDLNEIMIQAYNDWHVDEWCGAYPDRFVPCGILPIFDVERAAKEVRRLDAKGCHAVTFPENPHAIGLPSFHSGEWDPLFAACSDVGTIICLHVASSAGGVSTIPVDAPASVPMTLASTVTNFSLANLLWADFWFRFPALKIALTEGDIGWMPYFVDRAEHVQKFHSGWTRHDFPPGQGPRQVFLDHILCCFIDDRVGLNNLDEFNIDNVSWESDYPHSETTWPNSPEQLAPLLTHLDDEVIAKITHQNAIAHYQFDPFSVRPREACTAAALRAEAQDVDTVTRVGQRPGDDQAQRYLERRKHAKNDAAKSNA
jgi:predicted TIM-barrel fold metal-dependent hydrolase